MLRRQDYAVQLGEITYVAPPPQRCISRGQKIDQYKKAACEVGKPKTYGVDEYGTPLKVNSSAISDTHLILENQFKAQACHPFPPCYPMIKCKAKTSTLHDGTSNVSSSIVGLGVKGDGNMGHLYNSYREISIVDTDELVRQMRAGNEPVQSQITKEAEYKAGLFGGAFHEIDGVGTGYSCVKCPPIVKPCPVKRCKKPDPLNNPETGIGSDGLESKSSLFSIFEAARVEPKLEAFLGEGRLLPRMEEKDMIFNQEEDFTEAEMVEMRHEGTAFNAARARQRARRRDQGPVEQSGTPAGGGPKQSGQRYLPFQPKGRGRDEL